VAGIVVRGHFSLRFTRAAGGSTEPPAGFCIKWNFIPQPVTPKGEKKEAFEVFGLSHVGNMIVAFAPGGSARCAQFFTFAGYSPAPRQGSALHPCCFACTLCWRSSGAKAGNRARLVAMLRRHARSRADFAGAAYILGHALTKDRPLRGYRRAESVVLIGDRAGG